MILAEVRDWRTGIAASALVGRPIQAPLLFADGDTIPDATKAALDALQPTGSKEAGGAQVIRVGTKAPVEGYKTTDVEGANPAALAAAVDRLRAAAAGAAVDRRVVASSDRPEYAMPAAGWAAKSGDPLLWVGLDGVPPETDGGDEDAQERARSTCSGPPDAVPDTVLTALEKLGTVKRVAGTDAVSSAITFARYTDGTFGWSVVDPGHGLVFASTAPPAGRRGRRAAVGDGHLRAAAAAARTPACSRSRCRTTCSTSSPATTPTRSAASTTTAGSSATRARSPPPSRRG